MRPTRPFYLKEQTASSAARPDPITLLCLSPHTLPNTHREGQGECHTQTKGCLRLPDLGETYTEAVDTLTAFLAPNCETVNKYLSSHPVWGNFVMATPGNEYRFWRVFLGPPEERNSPKSVGIDMNLTAIIWPGFLASKGF